MSRFSWFDEARFGLFLHWGIYSLGAKSEWQKSQEQLSDAEYDRYFQFFNPDLFEPRQWAELARQAGMKYVVFTAKHHDGFCLWDSQYTDYNSLQAPRCQRDLTGPLLQAFREAGLQIGIYYSLPDWHHPNYCLDARHPQRQAFGISAENNKPIERESPKYAEFLRQQVRELLTKYGKIDLIWFDGGYPETKHIFEVQKLNQMIRQLQPEILINRLYEFSDFTSPEQRIPDSVPQDKNGLPVRWEGCQVIGQRWCYTKENQNWKSGTELIQMLVRHVSRGGNLLLNVGPTSRGDFADQDVSCLQELAAWMRSHSRSIHNCSVAPEQYPEPRECRYTWNPKTNCLYLHFFAWPDRRIVLPGLAAEQLEYAQLLQDGSEIEGKNFAYTANDGNSSTESKALQLTLPIRKPTGSLPVIELFLKK